VQRFRGLVCCALIVCVALFDVPVMYAQENPDGAPEGGAPEGGTPDGAPQEGVQGQLLELDGKTPVSNEAVKITDANTGEVVAEATTGPDGSFNMPELGEGSYVLETRGMSHPFELAAGQPLEGLRILAPAGGAIAPVAGGAVAAGGTSAWVWIGAAAAVVVLGAGISVPLVLEKQNDPNGTDGFTGTPSQPGSPPPPPPPPGPPPPDPPPAPMSPMGM